MRFIRRSACDGLKGRNRGRWGESADCVTYLTPVKAADQAARVPHYSSILINFQPDPWVSLTQRRPRETSKCQRNRPTPGLLPFSVTDGRGLGEARPWHEGCDRPTAAAELRATCQVWLSVAWELNHAFTHTHSAKGTFCQMLSFRGNPQFSSVTPTPARLQAPWLGLLFTGHLERYYYFLIVDLGIY